MKDYYKILEVDEKATKAEIKKSFRKLAKKYHPDVNKGNSVAENKFKDISEAYEVLSKDDERRNYDSARSGGGPFNFHGFSQDGPLRDFFHSSGTGGGSNFFEEILKGFGGFSGGNGAGNSQFSGFDSFFGGQRSAGASSAELKIPISAAMKGGQISVSGLPGGAQSVKIPPQTKNGSTLKVKSGGRQFNLKIVVEDEFPFSIKGNHIETTIKINIAQAVLGSKVKITDPKGDSFIITVIPGSQHGSILRMRKLGLPTGDLLVKLDISIPHDLSEDKKQSFIEFAETMNWKY